MCEISVIIPVYNVEKYLDKCLDSICNQSFRDIEIICVNDGSTDSSQNILLEYQNIDGRIRIINQENQGLGASRNNGLKEAKGKYVYFIDSDDYLDASTLERLHKNIISNKSDIALFKFKTFDDNNNIKSRIVEFRIDEIFGDIDYSNFTFTYKDVKKHVMNTAFSACLKLYRKDFLDSFDDFHFPEGVSFEDILFHVKVMLRASRISFVNEDFYYYRSNPNSILNSSANVFDIFKAIDMVEDFLRKNGFYAELENEFIFFKIAQILIYKCSKDPEKYFNRTREEFLKIQIKDKSTLKKYALDGYNQVLSSRNYSEYAVAYYKREIKKLKKENKRLSLENEKLKKKNQEIISSNSWKVTKPLRFMKKINK